jgi:SAM-dependent methyltransferase
VSPPDVKRRRSLTHVGGAVVTSGDRDLARLLARALDVQPARAPAPTESGADDADRVHVHGFHAYPARIHPTTAACLVRAVSREGATVLDPFCGSGTVIVEAMLARRRAIGTDLNPIAVKLAKLKTALPEAPARAAIASTAEAVGAFATDRRKRRAGATKRYPPEDVALFDPHVLLELDSIQAGIAARSGPEPIVRDALELVLSAILIKVSRRASETSAAMVPRRLAAGFATRLFVSKAAELARRLGDFALQLPAGVPPPRIELDDTAKLRTVPASTVDAVVTSPPYVSTYDYFAQHSARLRWLKLDATRFAASEMGARRRFGKLDAHAARSEWSRELVGVLRSIRRVCRPNARVVMVLADSAVQDEALRADTILAAVARETGFMVLAQASQTRPHFHAGTARAFQERPRSEHAIALEKQ